MKSYFKNKTSNWIHPMWQFSVPWVILFLCPSLTCLSLASAISNGNSLLPVSNSSSVITSCLFLNSGDYSYHSVCVIFLVETLLKKRWWTLHATFLSACGDESGKHTVHPGFVDSVWISVFLLLRWALNGQEHDVLWIIPVSVIHYPNGLKYPHNHQIVIEVFQQLY